MEAKSYHSLSLCLEENIKCCLAMKQNIKNTPKRTRKRYDNCKNGR